MLKQAIGATLGIIGALFCVMPLGYLGRSGFGLDPYQTGEQLGGIPHLLLLPCALYAVFTWTSGNAGNHRMAMTFLSTDNQEKK